MGVASDEGDAGSTKIAPVPEYATSGFIQVIQNTPNLPPPLPSLGDAMAKLPVLALVKVAQLGIGVDLLGSKLSLTSARGNRIEANALGIRAISGKNKRVVNVPWSNVRGWEELNPA